MGKLKQILLSLSVLGQLLGFGILFFNITVGILIFILSGLAMLAIFIVLIVERIKEKEEDDENDYRNY
ncbi:hypothetical protein ABE096_16945 [Robertmurraya massiliosenegalensis]|uniref:hypothetical protein n=1 Tax=Robertmurraya TaxID=2837507 RepID=UPI0039A65385